LVGISSGDVYDNYYDKDTSGQDDTGRGIPKSTQEMKKQATFEPEMGFC
jgi:hypothetical protein